MKRRALLIDQSNHKDVLIMVDLNNASEILLYLLGKAENEFKDIRNLLKENLRNREKYCKADVSLKADKMFEMRFTNNGRNDRIYCQDKTINKKRTIIMIELFEGKKSQDIPKTIKSRIETMGGYEYEL